jgi:hypothetical protein
LKNKKHVGKGKKGNEIGKERKYCKEVRTREKGFNWQRQRRVRFACGAAFRRWWCLLRRE